MLDDIQDAIDTQDQAQEECALFLREMNHKHAVIKVGGKTMILNEDFNPDSGRIEPTFSTISDFRAWYNNQLVQDGKTVKSKATVWLDWPDRRQCKGIVFSPEKNVPGYYNLFQGFAVSPIPGDWELMKTHIFEVIAGGNEDAYRYIYGWLANLVQHPAGRRYVALVLRGLQGTGKGTFVEFVGKIFGQHFLQITQPGQLTGRFNSHLTGKLLVFADEAVWGGDKAAEGTLKGLITEDHLASEAKGRDVISVRNHARFILASNEQWCAPGGP